jgi:hypothetical protein
MMTAQGLKRKVKRITANLKPYFIKNSDGFYNVNQSKGVCVIDDTIKNFDSTDGIEYFVIGTVARAANGRKHDEIYIKDMLFAWDAEGGLMSQQDLQFRGK